MGLIDPIPQIRNVRQDVENSYLISTRLLSCQICPVADEDAVVIWI